MFEYAYELNLGLLFILYSLLKDFPKSEEVWNLVARRPIDEANANIKKGTAVITGVELLHIHFHAICIYLT